jgi:ribosomal-protein-alanine N-acetyltransferase
VVTLEVRASNAVAQRLYESLGFVKAGTRPHYYADDGEDALTMRLEL